MYLFLDGALYLMILMGANPLLGPMVPENLDFMSQNATRFARCHFGAQKSLGFQGPLHGLINYKDSKP
jgi:hypothetical protein